jgi:hypothetical protein
LHRSPGPALFSGVTDRHPLPPGPGLPTPTGTPVDGTAIGEVLDQVRLMMATDSRDWSACPGDAWLYALFIGWECVDEHEHDEINCSTGTLDLIAGRFGWTHARVERIRAMRQTLRAAAAED